MKRGKWNMLLSDEDRIRLSELMGREVKYRCPERITYFSKRYGKTITVAKGYLSDGATGAQDVNSQAWWVHDVMCERGTWDDRMKCTNWQASMVIRAILWRDKFWFRSNRWFAATWLLGGGKARDNGMW